MVTAGLGVPRARPAAPRMRLTRRGRTVVASAAALLVMLVMTIASIQAGAGAAQATSHAISRGAAERNLTQVTVRPGQNLWTIAEAADPDADVRVIIQEIIEDNALTGTELMPGQQLRVPRG